MKVLLSFPHSSTTNLTKLLLKVLEDGIWVHCFFFDVRTICFITNNTPHDYQHLRWNFCTYISKTQSTLAADSTQLQCILMVSIQTVCQEVWQTVSRKLIVYTYLQYKVCYIICYIEAFIPKTFFVFSATKCWLKALGVRAGGSWIWADSLCEIRR